MNGKKIIKTKKRLNIKRLINNAKKNITTIIKEFKKLDESIKKIIIMWALIFFIIVIIGISYKINNKTTDKYRAIEKNMTEAAQKYALDNQLFPTDASPLNLSLDAMLEYNYLSDENIDNSCEGYSKIVYNDIEDNYIIDSYITCHKYTTEGYSNNK